MGGQAPGYVRTGAPIAAGSILMWIASHVFGITLDASDVLVILPIIQSAYYVLVRVLETYNPKLGYALGIAKQPAYSSAPAPAPGAGEDVKAVIVPENPPVGGDGEGPRD